MSTRRLALLCAVALSAATLRPVAFAQPTVDPSAPPAANAAGSSVGANIRTISDAEPVLDVDLVRTPDGTLHALYTVGPAYVMPKVMHRTSRDAGQTWSEPTSLMSDDNVGLISNLYTPAATALVDASGRVYVVYAQYDRNASKSQLVHRVLENGTWSAATPLGNPSSLPSCFFACVDPNGKAHAVWTEKYQYRAKPEDSPWEKANGMVYEATLDGASATAPRLVHEPRFSPDPRYVGYCDGYAHIDGTVDANGRVRYVALRNVSPDGSDAKDIGAVYFNGEQQWMLWPSYDAARQSDRGFHVRPRLVADAAGSDHVIVSSTKDQPPVLYALDVSRQSYALVAHPAGAGPAINDLQAIGGASGVAVTFSAGGNVGSDRDPLDLFVARLDPATAAWTSPRMITRNVAEGSTGTGAVLDWSNVQMGSTSAARGVRAAPCIGPDGAIDLLLHLEVTGTAITDLGGTSSSTLAGSGTTTTLAFTRVGQ